MFQWLSTYNCDFALATLPVQLLLFLFYFGKSYLPTRQNRDFVTALGLNFALTIVSIAACAWNPGWASYSYALLYGVNIAYCVLFLLRSWYLFEYTADELYAYQEIPSIWRTITMLPLLAALFLTVLTPWTGWVFRFDSSDGFQTGPFSAWIFGAAWAYLAFSAGYIAICRQQADSLQKFRLYAFNLILAVGFLLDSIFPYSMTSCYFSLLAILIIYLGAQNPERYIEPRTFLFNHLAFQLVMREYLDRKDYWLFGFVIQNYNDTRELYGGTQMDRGLAAIGRYLESTIRDSTTFYLRNGRFLLASQHPMDTEKIQHLLKQRFRTSWSAGNAEIFANIGCVSMEPRLLRSMENVVNCLSMAFKEAGGVDAPDIHIDREYWKHVHHHLRVKRALDRAILNDGIEIFIQPLARAESGKIVGAEALARIRGADGKLIFPDEFIPMAEHDGSISQLGEQIFRKACAFMSREDIQKSGLEWMNVNLSPIQCHDLTLAEDFADIKKHYHLSDSAIHLEITEASMESLSTLKEKVSLMQKDGFQFVLDDFGSGYSNARMVKQIPFVNVKLDKDIVQDHFKKPDSYLQNVILSLRDLGYEVTAEGVETKHMVDTLKDMGVDYLQGYYYAKPMPAKDFVHYLGEDQGAAKVAYATN